MKKLSVVLIFIFCSILISCNEKPDTSKFNKQIKGIRIQIESLEQDLINADTQTKRAIGLAEHFRDLYFKEREKTDSLKNELNKMKLKKPQI